MALSPRETRMLMVLGGVVAVGLVVLVFMMLQGGGGDGATGGEAGGAAAPGGTPVPEAAGGTPSPVGIVDAFPITCCDPFSPLPVPSPSPTETGSPQPSPTPSPQTASDEITVFGNRVRLNEIVDRPKGAVIGVEVNGVTYKDLETGTKFAKYFRVEAISTDVACASFEYRRGKTTETFRLCIVQG